MHSIIVSDLDGTLLNPDHRVSERTKQAIHNLLATGKRFIIATVATTLMLKQSESQLALKSISSHPMAHACITHKVN